MKQQSGHELNDLQALDEWLQARLDGADSPPPAGMEALAWSLLQSAESADDSRPWSPLQNDEFRDNLAAALDQPERHQPGTRIGAFTLQRELGAGGMGVVYLAERSEGGFTQQVALKLLSDHFSRAEHIRQFNRERQLLARLEHPGIARLIDGGITTDGQPWFAMEYVEGVPLDVYARQHRLNIRQRLDLILQLCQALDYAHSKLVLHRDIKPNNILVDGSGRLKLLDFGLGRARDADSDNDNTVTQVAWRWLTPDYASPEQVRGEPITLTSEIYQVGLVMYRLLSLHAPYAIRETSPVAMVQAICDTVPQMPSNQWQQGADAELPERALQLESTPDAVRKNLRGDLDNIIMMALAKKPDERYRNLGELMEDIRRHLDNQPVRARAATTGYRLQKFLLRYRAGVTSAAIVFLLISAALVVISVQSVQLAEQRDSAQLAEQRALTEAAKARQVRDYLTGLFEQASPRNDGGRDLTAYDLLQQGAKDLDELAMTPLIQAEMMLALATANRNLLDFEQAAALLDEALTVLENTNETGPQDLAEVLIERARVYQQSNDHPAARQRLQRAQELLEPAFTSDNLYASLLRHLAITAANLREFEQAENLMLRAIDLYARLGNDEDRFWTINDLAAFYIFTEQPAQAQPLFQALVDRRTRLYGADDARTLHSKRNLAAAWMDSGQLQQAKQVYLTLREQYAEMYGAESQELGAVLYRLGRIALEQDELGDSAALLAEANRLRLHNRGPKDANLATVMSWQAEVARRQQKPLQAIEFLQQALSIYEQISSAPHPRKLELRLSLARLFSETQQLPAAQQVYAKTAESLQTLDDRFRAEALDGMLALITATADSDATLARQTLARQTLASATAVLAAARDAEQFSDYRARIERLQASLSAE